MSATTATENIAHFENITFTYQEVNEPEKIDDNHYFVVYSNNTIRSINNVSINTVSDGHNVEQISISYQMFYENNDGTTPANILNSDGIEREHTVEYANIKFMYNERVVDGICENQFCYVYNDITIISSDNPIFKKDDAIEQITVCIEFFLENEDGTTYNM